MIKRLLSLVLLLAVLIGGLLAWWAATPMVARELPVEFSIPPGTPLKTVAQQLAAQGVLEQPGYFVLLARLLGKAGQIKAGGYLLSQPITPYQLLGKITAGETLLSKATFIEGWTFRQMRAAIDAHPRLKHETTHLSDEALLVAIGATEKHPEGRFFPDTYYFDAGESDLTLYKRAYHAMARKLDETWRGRKSTLPYTSPDEVLTMASIIEKETGAPDERPLIAAVFINRLRIGMRLQTDPTVIYGLGERFDGNLRKSDLLADTPYNTYTRAGLPPTPIALPGEAALRAAVEPADSRALYFVAKGAGRHQFSNTLEEHNRAVSRYQRGGR